jgi:hypothetical protein
VDAYIFTDGKIGSGETATHQVQRTASVAMESSGGFTSLETPYSVADFQEGGQSVVYANVFLHVTSDNNFVGFCVPGTAESSTSGLQPGANVDVTMYTASHGLVGGSQTSLLSCVSPPVLKRPATGLDPAVFYLSFVTGNKPDFIKVVLRVPEGGELIFDSAGDADRFVAPGFDVGIVSDIEKDLYLGFRMLKLLADDIPAGSGTFKVRLEIGFNGGLETYPTNEVEVPYEGSGT